MDFDNILTLIKVVSESSLTNVTLEDKEFKISMKTDKGNKMITTEQEEHIVYSSPIKAMNNIGQAESTSSNSNSKYNGNVVKSPLVGTFYSAPSADADPFVTIGDTVKRGQVLGIVEAMKLMNEIECEYDGIVKEILISNEEVVEYGQSLFVISE